MAAKVKGLFKGFKNIPNVFAYKEPEMVIGYPTDVKHVAHIGCDASPGIAPSWMNEFKTTSQEVKVKKSVRFEPSSAPEHTGSHASAGQLARQADNDHGGVNPMRDSMANHPRSEIPKAPKKSKRKKTKVSTESSSISSRVSYTTAVEDFDELQTGY